jgi:hypothetical protein
MKKYFTLLFAVGMVLTAAAQAPQGFNYQAALRNGSGQPLVSSAVTMRFGIYSGAGATTKIYEETQALNTNTAGLVTCVIGKGTVALGTFNTINWGGDIYSLKVEANTGGGFVDMGTQQMVSVPYALHTENAATLSGSITPSQISQGGALANQVLTYTGMGWQPSNPASTITDIVAGTGLSGGGSTGSVTLNAKTTTALWNANQIQGVGVTAGATSGQFLKYNGTNWLAADPFISAAGTGVTVTSGTINTPWTISGNNIYKNNTGNVGIGATTPTELLHTQSGTGNAYNLAEVTSAALDAGFSAKSTNGANDYFQMVKHGSSAGGTTAGGIALANLSRLTAGAGAGPMLLHVITSNPMIFATNNVERMRIAGTGEIGIGINVPTTMAKFHVVGSGAYGTSPYYQAAIVGDDTFSTHLSATGIYGKSGWRGIFGHNKGTAGGGQAIGVYGLQEGSKYSTGYGVYGENYGTGPTNYGVYGTTIGAGKNNYGLYGSASGGTTSNYGIYTTVSGTGPYAGYFNGAIYATSANSSIKAFKIDHPQDPENKYLYHSSIESPDMMNVYNGNVVTDANGNATIQLPAYFMALNKDFKYQLTCMGQFAQAIVMDEIKDNQFTIKTDKPNVKVSWMVTGVRQDAAANYARIQVEVDKPASEKGYYLVPQAYGFGMEKNAAANQSQELKKVPANNIPE